MKTLAALAFAALLLQAPTLERDYRATRPDGSRLAMITLIAVHEDGTPVRGEIQCAGHWFQHADEHTVRSGRAIPFATDARGAVIFNPSLDDEWIVCWSADRGSRGQVTVDFDAEHPTAVRTLVLRKES